MAYALKAFVGKLAITQVSEPVVAAEVQGYIQTLGSAIMKVPGQVVIFTDIGSVTRGDAGVMDAYKDVLRSTNSKILRSALYVKRDSPVGLWIYNLVKNDANPGRRMFTNVAEAQTWLDEALDPLEKSALATYVAKLK